MSINVHLSFKAKLNMAIVIAILGFALVTSISLNALGNLKQAASRVDHLNYNVRLLNNLQVSVLQLKGGKDARLFAKLQHKYAGALSQITEDSEAEVYESIIAINAALADWVEVNQQMIATEQLIGDDLNSGLRGDVSVAMQEFNEKLFAIFKKDSAELKQHIITFAEQRSQQSFAPIDASVKVINQLAEKTGFEGYIRPKTDKIAVSIKRLSRAIFNANSQHKRVLSVYKQLASGVKKTTESFDQQLLAAKANSELVSEHAVAMVLSFSVLVAVLVLFLLLGTSRSLVNTLSRMSAVLAKLAKGDLTQRTQINQRRNDALDNVGESVNEMTKSINSVLCSVSDTCHYLAEGSRDLRGSLQDMISGNERTNLQADSIAAAVEQISVTMSGMSESVNRTLQQSQLAGESAQQGGRVINHALESFTNLDKVFDALNIQLSALEKESVKIDGVTDIIRSLAGQTNLLALNAAIEAARAGDAGRGFSVVATEVRNLAEETVVSTKNIADIIDAMKYCIKEIVKEMKVGNSHVTNGRELADHAKVAITEIKRLSLDVSDQSGVLTSNIIEANNATQSIAENMEELAANVSINTEKGQSVNSYVNVVSTQTIELLAMIEKFNLAKE
ncbi:MAG: methyl-accepting chemotaxis protein [Pseudomonadales bacterium]|nr:methyl-accepting chemotaxis protein [Pseudomonadales bacterium]NRA17043.1 methyl-accepting chemotaxis protein [Oceanospirillaceae bacterium]